MAKKEFLDKKSSCDCDIFTPETGIFTPKWYNFTPEKGTFVPE